MKILFKSELVKGRVEKQVLRELEIQSRLKYALQISYKKVLDSLSKYQISGIQTFSGCSLGSMMNVKFI